MKMLFCTQIQNKIGSLNWAHLFILWRRISARHHWEHWLFACVSWKCYPGFPILYFSIKILKLSNLREAITSKIIHYENCAENILFFIKRDISFREPCLYAELLLDYGFERNQDCCTGTTPEGINTTAAVLLSAVTHTTKTQQHQARDEIIFNLDNQVSTLQYILIDSSIKCFIWWFTKYYKLMNKIRKKKFQLVMWK